MTLSRWRRSGVAAAFMALLMAGAGLQVHLPTAGGAEVSGATISGVVRDSAGTPLADICVAPYRPADSFGVQPSCTGADGTYVVNDLPDGSWTVNTEDPTGQYGAGRVGPIQLTAGQTVTGLDFVLLPAGSIVGTVVDRRTGDPLAGWCPFAYYGQADAYVRGSIGTCSNAAGTWSIAGLAPGQYAVVISGNDGVHQERWATDARTQAEATLISVASAETVSAGTVRLYRGGSITGRITDRAGRPVVGAAVNYGNYTNLFADEGKSAYTDSDGRYTITNVDQGRDVVLVSAWGQPYAWQFSGRASDPSTATKVAVRYGQATRFDAVLGPEAKLAVTISGSAGGDNAQYGIDTYSPSGALIGFFMNIPGNGTKSVNGLPPGTYKVRVRVSGEPDLWYRNATSLAEATPFRVTIGRPTTITIQVPE